MSNTAARNSIALALVSICFLVSGCRDVSTESSELIWTRTIRGSVTDTLTKKPIPGAIVDLDREPSSRLMPSLKFLGNEKSPGDERGREQVTDAKGRFEFTGIDLSSHFFSITKPGYTSSTHDATGYSSYEVHPGLGMGELKFYLTPGAQLSGHVASNGGQAMKGVPLTLYREFVRDGRGVWHHENQASTDASGFYTFSGLKEGTYVVISGWILDNDPEPGSNCRLPSSLPESGYARTAIPDVRDFSSAAPIRLTQGQHVVGDLRLEHQAFHQVLWRDVGVNSLGFSTLRDRNGRTLQMDGPPGSHCGWVISEHYDPVTRQRTINLPDGVYTLGNHVRFTVSGNPLTVPSEPEHSESAPSVRINIHFDFTDPKRMCSGIVSSAVSSPQDSDQSPSRHVLWLSRADPLPEDSQPIHEMISRDNSPEFSYVEPGNYWVHAVEPGNTSWTTFAPNTYVAAITAEGVDMSREPLVVGLNGISPPLKVTLRNDCGTLKLNYLAPNPHGDPAGIVRVFFGLLVPQFAGFMNEHSFLFEPGRTQNISIGNLAPGHYKFYVVRQERGIAFKSSENTPTSLGPGQDVWLHPGEKEEISVVEPDLE